MSRDPILPAVLPVTASAVDAFTRCPRLYRNRHLLALPESDAGLSPDLGNLVHDLLRVVHETGSCRDPAHVDDVLVGHGVDPRGSVHSMIERHAARCPAPAEHARHEYTLARLHRSPSPRFMATGRLDAVWKHDGILDVRDYKTGRKSTERVADDPRARIQAWIAAPLAARRDLRLRIRYEHLADGADDDPDPFEPDADDLAAIEDELRTFVIDVHAAERRGFGGVREVEVCRACPYRSICPDSASPGEPSWPVPPDDDPVATGDEAPVGP